MNDMECMRFVQKQAKRTHLKRYKHMDKATILLYVLVCLKVTNQIMCAKL